MIHLGDITKINGARIPPVDVVTGGSPCQDLSLAGKRAGLAGERSGLFMEQIRIVKEMREQDVRSGRNPAHARPRYMVWENVDGARTSPGGNRKGADFAAVLEEIIKAAEPGADVCVCVPDGGWTKSGCYYAEDGTWSVAWRVHDAQFWGVPQRRKRIALVADFGGLSAPEVLFERKGLSRDIEPCGETGQETTGAAGGGVEGASWGIDHVITTGGNCTAQGPCVYEEVEATLKAAGPHAVFSAISFQERAGKPGGGKGILIQHEHVGALSTLNNQSVLSFDPSMSRYAGTVFKDVAKTLTPGTSPGHHDAVAYGISAYDSNAMKSPNPYGGSYGTGGDNQPLVVGINGQIAGTLDSNYFKGCGERQGVEREVVCVENGQANQSVYAMQSSGDRANPNISVSAEKTFCVPANPMSDRGQSVANGRAVRRLTPLECERLQGYPDGWTDIGDWVDSNGKKHKAADSPRYKALGNSIALPFWFWLLRRISAQYERPATLGSLFDGIGGFPLCWERCNGMGTAIWASEIEEFPIAVTKKRFNRE